MESPLELVKRVSVNDSIDSSETRLVETSDKSDILDLQADDCVMAEVNNTASISVTGDSLGTVCPMDSKLVIDLPESPERIKPEIVSDDEYVTGEKQRSRPRQKKTSDRKRKLAVKKNRETRTKKSVKLNHRGKTGKGQADSLQKKKPKKSLDTAKRGVKNSDSLATINAGIDGGNSRRQPFICGECSERFSDASRLVKHMEHHVADVIASFQETSATVDSHDHVEEPPPLSLEMDEPESEYEEVDVPSSSENDVLAGNCGGNAGGITQQRLSPLESPGRVKSKRLIASEEDYSNIEEKDGPEKRQERKPKRQKGMKKKLLIKRKRKSKEIETDTDWVSSDEPERRIKKERRATSRGEMEKSEIAETKRYTKDEILEMTPDNLAEFRKKKSQISRLVKRKRALLATPQSCDQCGKSFPYASDLKRHMLSHLKPNVCEDCGERFSYASRLAVHRLKHSGERSVACPVCSHQFLCEATLTRHMLKHDTAPMLCTICNRRFSMEAYQRHLVRHANGTLKALACRSCGVEFTEALKLKEHEKTHAADQPQDKPHQCTVCERRFTRRTLLRLHERVHTGERPYLCPECGSTFSSRSMFRVHVSTHALRAGRIDKVERGLLKVCNHCGRQFVGPSALRCHMRKHAIDRPYHCSRCDAKFKYAVSLRRHEERHEGIPRFYCDQCGKSFVDKIALCRHSYKHPDKLADECGENRCFCADCSMNFASEASLMEHLQKHDARTVLRCSFCDELFGSKTKLALHEQKHVRPFRCEYCSKRFARKDHMQIHTRLHTGEKPYRCQTCGEAFGDPSRLYVHRRNLHGINAQIDVSRRTYVNRESPSTNVETLLESTTNSIESSDCMQAVCYAIKN